eukprot:CAMPEP_0119529428 /NCGR_PEP_ID=MMETSP1344-20130328/43443_1 /TAXON_ID=236787 /ORGANISM="Florenciella parvula, Strain CCMP2471" /LENGTH=66 /DNA_ID=CAMNT_0007569061 /DNA_START=366 /DNA_END=566 /DNA_ORIENTATION=+
MRRLAWPRRLRGVAALVRDRDVHHVEHRDTLAQQDGEGVVASTVNAQIVREALHRLPDSLAAVLAG